VFVAKRQVSNFPAISAKVKCYFQLYLLKSSAKQRREIQMLVCELRDRDSELNGMSTAHQHQLQAWEQDRHRLLTLEQKCHQYQGMVKVLV
jgi:hypothetical protein